MEEVGHSPLLKFFVSGYKTKMSEPNIESEVPGEQNIREGDNQNEPQEGPSIQNATLSISNKDEVATESFTLEPVITVTKQETTLTKGEMKLQKVTVTEDISETTDSSVINRRLTHEIKTNTKIPHPTGAMNGNSRHDGPKESKTETNIDESKPKERKTKIPMLRFKQAVDRVKRERKEQKNAEVPANIPTRRKSSIPRLKEGKIPLPTDKDIKIAKEEELTKSEEDEFDKIFREMNEMGSSVEVLNSKEEIVSQVESSFEELIHAYEDNKVETIEVEKVKQSRIPLPKRKSEHAIEFPRTRERLPIRKSLSVDMDKVESCSSRTDATELITTLKSSKAYTETNTEKVTLRSKISYSNETSVAKRQGIKKGQNIYDTLERMDKELESQEDDDNIDKKQEVDTSSTDLIISSVEYPDETVDTCDIAENYDDKSETQLTKISSEQVRFDKQIVSKIYKIDFTENTFELTDSEMAEPNDQQTNSEELEETTAKSFSKQDSHTEIINFSQSAVTQEDSQYEMITKTLNSEEITQMEDIKNEDTSEFHKSISRESHLNNKTDASCKQELDLDKTIGTTEMYTTDNKSNTEHTLHNTHEIKYTTNLSNETAALDTKNERKELLEKATYEIVPLIETGILVAEGESNVIQNFNNEVNLTTTTFSEISNTGNDSINKGLVTTETLSSSAKFTAEKRSGKIGLARLKEAYQNPDFFADIKKESIEVREEVKNIDIDELKSRKLIKERVIIAPELMTKESENSKILTLKDSAKYIKYTEGESEESNTSNINEAVKETVVRKQSPETLNKESDDFSKTTRKYFNFDRLTVSQTESSKSTKTNTVTQNNSATRITSPKLDAIENKAENDPETFKIYSDVFSKMSKVQTITTESESNIIKATEKTTSEALEKVKTENNKIDRTDIEEAINTEVDKTDDEVIHKTINKSVLDESETEDGVTILKGKVSRIVRRIASVDNTKVEDKSIAKGMPVKQSILSKIAMFERDEPNGPYTKAKPAKDPKIPHYPPTRQTSKDLRRPKIVDEIYKEYKDSKFKSTSDYNQEEISIEISNQTAKQDVTRSSKLYDYKTVKDFGGLQVAKTELRQLSREEKLDVNKSDLTTSAKSTSYKNGEFTADIENEQENVSNRHYETSYKTSRAFRNSKSCDSSIHVIDTETKSNLDLNNSDNSKENVNSIVSDGRKYNEQYRKYEKRKGSSVSELSTIEKLERREARINSELRRMTSVVEQDLGDVIKGKVKGMIMRINSMERLELSKTKIDEKEKPRGSVMERIALFESKGSTLNIEKNTTNRRWNRTVETMPQELDEESCAARLAELKESSKTYGFTNSSYIELRDGRQMPVIALGTALLDKRLVRQVVEAAIELGYRAIDTAFIYGNEKEVGEGINAKINDGTVKREDLYIISKLWSTFHRRDLVETACRASLEAMGLKYFDLYLIHNPMSFKEGGDPLPRIANVLQFSEHDYMDAWYGIEDLVAKGLILSGGLSNFNSEQVHRINDKGRLKPVVNQVECHPYLSQDRLAGFCDAFGMKLMCYGTLGAKGTPKGYKSSLPPAIDDPLVQVMAAGLGVTSAQLLVAFQVRKGRSVVVKASSAQRLHENLAAQRLPLASGQLTAITSLDRHKRIYTFEGMGETHRNYPFKIAF